MQHSPSTIAREALRQLAERRLAPSPENYARAYFEISTPGRDPAALDPAAMLRELVATLRQRGGEPPKEIAALERALSTGDWDGVRAALLTLTTRAAAEAQEAGAWSGVLRELVAQWEARIPGVTQARKRQALDHLLNAFEGSSAALYPRLKSLLRSWREAGEDAPAATAAEADPMAEPPAAPSAREAAAALLVRAVTDEEGNALLRELLAQTLQFGIVERLGYNPPLALEAQALAATAREAVTPAALAGVANRLKKFWIALEIRGDDQRAIHAGLLRLLRLAAGNLAELAENDSWSRGQTQAIERFVGQPVDAKAIGDLERLLRDAAIRQGTAKNGRDQARDAMKALLGTFVDQLGTIAQDAGGYHDRMEQFADEIARTDDLSTISSIVGAVLKETREMQASVARSRQDIAAAKEKADGYQQRVHALETELAAVSERLHEDMLTQVFNRRGLDRSYESEAARADRRGEPLCLALLDVDNFKAVNDRHGHQAGDLALTHLAAVMRDVIRPGDVIARFGGEEFVILLPDTTLEAAKPVLMRIQRELTRRYFLHNNERLLITFSAGIAERRPGEGEEALLARADTALYAAKQAGKNRVEV